MSLTANWQTWAAEHTPEKLASRPIDYMHERHGVRTDATCSVCAELWCKEFKRRYYHCAKYDKPGTADGPATDWRLSWLACGLFRERER